MIPFLVVSLKQSKINLAVNSYTEQLMWLKWIKYTKEITVHVQKNDFVLKKKNTSIKLHIKWIEFTYNRCGW